jgi:phosphoserine aminotransferase
VNREIFEGSTINTPSMLCVEDYIDALGWADSIGGLKGLINKSHDNLAVLERFVDETVRERIKRTNMLMIGLQNWIHFLAKDPASRSNTSVCVTLDLVSAELLSRDKGSCIFCNRTRSN